MTTKFNTSMKIFTVHDSKAELNLVPMFFKTHADALRAFETTCKDPNSQFAKFPADFSMKIIGAFDDTTGSIQSCDHTVIAHASDYQND